MNGVTLNSIINNYDAVSALSGGSLNLNPSDAAETAFSLGISGDYLQPFDIPSSLVSEKSPVGAAANSGQTGSVDRTSRLYAQALELESYFVKIMISSMRNTIQKSGFSGEDNFASRMYEDMLYDQFSRTVTKNAGFGLADQIYLQLSV